MDSIIILTPIGSPGITASHKMLANFFKRRYSNVYLIFNLFELFKTSLKIRSVIFPVHFWYLGIIFKIFGFKVIFICHGKPCRAHYNLFKFIAITVLIELCYFIANFSIFVSKHTRGRHTGYIFHNLSDNSNYIIKLPNQLKYIIFFGRVDRSKGIVKIFDLINKVRLQNHLDINFLIAGRISDNFKSEFNYLLKKFTYASYLGTYSNLDQLSTLLKDYQGIFLSLNFNEPFGIVYLEALKLGLLPIIPDNAGFSEVTLDLPTINSLDDLSQFILQNASFNSIYNININIVDDRDEILKII